MAAGRHEEFREGLGSTISPLKVITVLEQLGVVKEVVHLMIMSVKCKMVP